MMREFDQAELDKYRLHPGRDGDGIKAGDRVAVQDKSGKLWTGVVKSEWTNRLTGERHIRMGMAVGTRRNGKATQQKAEWLDAMLKLADDHPSEMQRVAIAHPDGTRVYEIRRAEITPADGWRVTDVDEPR